MLIPLTPAWVCAHYNVAPTIAHWRSQSVITVRPLVHARPRGLVSGAANMQAVSGLNSWLAARGPPRSPLRGGPRPPPPGAAPDAPAPVARPPPVTPQPP